MLVDLGAFLWCLGVDADRVQVDTGGLLLGEALAGGIDGIGDEPHLLLQVLRHGGDARL